MATKEWLSRGWRLDKEIQALETAKNSAMDRMTRITTHHSDINVQTSNTNRREEMMAKYCDYCSKLDNRISRLIETQDEILNAIEAVDDQTCRKLLTDRYINFKSFEQIAVDMSYSFRNVIRLHRKALQKVKMS